MIIKIVNLNLDKKDCISKGLLDPKDLLSAFDYLLNDNSSYVNGQNIIVDVNGWLLNRVMTLKHLRNLDNYLSCRWLHSDIENINV